MNLTPSPRRFAFFGAYLADGFELTRFLKDTGTAIDCGLRIPPRRIKTKDFLRNVVSHFDSLIRGERLILPYALSEQAIAIICLPIHGTMRSLTQETAASEVASA